MENTVKEALTKYAKVKVSFIRARHTKNIQPLRSPNCAAELFKKFFDTDTIELREYFFAMYLDGQGKPLAVVKINEGCLFGAMVDKQSVVRIALECNASAVVICHNHPSGNLKPSKVDIELTIAIKAALALFSIKLTDHIILTEDSFYSFADEDNIL